MKALVPDWLKRLLLAIEAAGYAVVSALLVPVNALLARLLRRRVVPGSVLHMSGMVHIAFHTVRILRERGVNADYLAIGESPWWSESDFCYRASRWPVVSVLKEMWWVWAVVSRYEIVHTHFMVTVSRTGWEWPLLKQMGRHLVVHYRGCEVRDRELNQRLHPAMNICQECDYDPPLCKVHASRRRLAEQHGSAFLVTTPDMKDFTPQAMHLPFFVTNPVGDGPLPARGAGRPFRIVHATNHPGIEGTRHIHDAVAALVARGFAIELVDLRGVTHDRVLAALADADVTIGKMKMGYYANLQVESLAAGVPAITWVRDDLMTDAIRASGLIITPLAELESTIERLITSPAELAARRAAARGSVARLHDNAAIADRLKDLYRSLAPDRS